MQKRFCFAIILYFLTISLFAQLKPGDKAFDFELENVDGQIVSLSDYIDQKGVILVFTCNLCPFSKAYEQRIIKLHKTYAPLGYPVIAVNPNDPSVSPDDSMEKMRTMAQNKSYPFAYLKDNKEVYKVYGALRTPYVFLLQKNDGSFRVAYKGAIDNNAMDERSVSERYVDQAIYALENSINPEPTSVEAIGCTIKVKK